MFRQMKNVFDILTGKRDIQTSFSLWKKVKVHIDCCGGCNELKAHFQEFTKKLHENFPGQLILTSKLTPEKTQIFEVYINDELVHSKKGGDGLVDEDAKFRKIIDAIKAGRK